MVCIWHVMTAPGGFSALDLQSSLVGSGCARSPCPPGDGPTGKAKSSALDGGGGSRPDSRSGLSAL